MEISSDIRNDATAIRFTGDSKEYFRIWIVNTALTIITLSLYAPWAKVRKLRYFYTHTGIDDSHFDFHARPASILIGQLIAMVMMGLYFGSPYIHPVAPLIVIIMIFVLTPWLVVRSRIFRMRNSSFRGIRFGFKPNYRGAFGAYVFGAFITAVSFGLATPTALHWKSEFVVNNSKFGQTQFQLTAVRSMFYQIFYKMVGLSLLGVLGYFFFMMFAQLFEPRLPRYENDPAMTAYMIYTYAVTTPLFLMYLAAFVYLRVRLRNYVWSNTSLGNNTLSSTLSASRMYFLYITNALAILLTIGLMIPWAQIRMARYRAEHTKVFLAEDWKSYLSASDEDPSAIGDEVGQAFDVDIGIGF